MKFIALTQGKVAVVDDCDYEYLKQWKWTHSQGYAIRKSPRRGGKQTTILMHRLVARRAGLRITGVNVDHYKDGGLDNRRGNLRIANQSQNCANQRLNRNNTSGYKGVSWYPKTKRWKVQIGVNRRVIHLGFRVDIKEAARLYDKAAKKYFGKFARTNAMEGLL